MRRTQSNHIKFLLNEFENENEDNQDMGYIKAVNPRIKVNETIKPYHYLDRF